MENVYTAFKPLYLVSKLFGAFPMSFEGPARNGVLKTKIRGLIASFASIAFMVFMIVMKFSNKNLLSISSSVFLIAWNYLVVLELSFLIIQLCFQLHKVNEYRDFLKLLNDFDITASQLGLKVNFKRHKWLACLTVLSIFIVNISGSIVTVIFYHLNGFVKQMNGLVAYSYAHKNFFKLFFVMQLLLASFAVKERFELLNNFLR
jgi:hypothetical protein